MTVGGAFRAAVKANSALYAAVGARIHQSYIPSQDSMPALGYRMISGSAFMTLTGSSGLRAQRFEVTAWSDKAAESDRLCQSVILLLRGFNGTLGGQGGVKVAVVGVNGPRNIVDEKSGLFGCQCDFLLHVDEDTIS